LRKSTIPEWAIARPKPQKPDLGDELVRDMQFISYLVVFGSSVDYGGLTPNERATTDRLLRMGVLVEAESEAGAKKLKLAEAWRRAIEDRQKTREQLR
jgi:hypothetical protein